MILRQPLIATSRDGQFDVIVTVKGGGLSGQAGAVRHGISRALVAYEPTLRPVLKPGGFLTRDPRAVERKKYGRLERRAAASSSRSAKREEQIKTARSDPGLFPFEGNVLALPACPGRLFSHHNCVTLS